MPPKESTRDRRGEWLTSFGEHRRVIGLAGDAETRALLVLGLCFGLRKGEILGLEWGHVDFGRREIHVRQTYTYTVGEPDMTPPKTRQSRRTVPMTDFAFGQMVALRDCGGVTRIAGPVADHGGRPVKPRRATTLIERFREAHDVPRINMSTLRHSFATAAIRAGIDVASVSKWLGHTDVTTTLNRYVRPLLTDLKEDAKAIDRAYARAANGT
ncbi:MAG: site-specific integrase [Coriobacteriales bacterium]|nr:site-specific integrase [Coriobacteriales bacterium]